MLCHSVGTIQVQEPDFPVKLPTVRLLLSTSHGSHNDTVLGRRSYSPIGQTVPVRQAYRPRSSARRWVGQRAELNH